MNFKSKNSVSMPATISENEVKAFSSVFDVLRYLRGPSGCPWDQRQTLQSLRTNMLEESAELIEIIHRFSNKHDDKSNNQVCADLEEEFGDVFLVWALMLIIYQENNPNALSNILTALTEKLIRRHPHVFENLNRNMEDNDLATQWEEIKKTKEGKKSTIVSFNEFHPALDVLERTKKIQQYRKKVSHSLKEKSREHRKSDAICELRKILNSIEKHSMNRTQPDTVNSQEYTDEIAEHLIAQILYTTVTLARAYNLSPTAALMRLNTKNIEKAHNEC